MEIEDKQSEGSDRFPDVVTRHRAGYIKEFNQDGNQFEFICENDVTLVITVLTEQMFRLRYAAQGEFMPDFSYAIDEKFNPEQPQLYCEEYDEYYAIATFQLTCQVMKQGLLVNFFDRDGNIICEDEEGFYLRESLMKGITEIKVTKKAPP